MNCQDLEKDLLLFAYEELSREQRAACDAHLVSCEACRAKLAETRRLMEAFKEAPRPGPTGDLLAHCRQRLDEALDHEQLGWRALARGWLRGLGFAPATQAATALGVLLLGFGVGWNLRPHLGSLAPANQVAPQTSFNAADLSDLRIRNISQVASDPQSGGVRITLDAERRVTLEGSLDDPRIRELLVGAVKSYDNPGIRRDTLEVLRTHRNNPAVLEALLFSMRHDDNAGVRLEALKAAGAVEVCATNTHQVLLDALQHDPNPGVRVAAIKTLIEHEAEEGADPDVDQVLRKLAASDRNPYIRMQCQAAVQHVEGEE